MGIRKISPAVDGLRRFGIVLAVGLVVAVALAGSIAQDPPQAQRGSGTGVVQASILLPGQQIWKNGVSSFLFGANDSQEWAADNVETNGGIQQDLKAANFTLMRTFFFDKSLADHHRTSDAEIEKRLQTVEHSGMVCLGVLYNIFNVAFAKHVIEYAGNRCNLYEFGNEPDQQGISMQAYLRQWNSIIPQLRQINPRARFIGPSVANFENVQGFLLGVKASGVLPDAISFHMYACSNRDAPDVCLPKAAYYGQAAIHVKQWVKSILGRDLPVGITEWNMAAGFDHTLGDNASFMYQFTTAALKSMIGARLAFANQFDVQSYADSGALDMFDIYQHDEPKAQYYAMEDLVSQYRPPS